MHYNSRKGKLRCFDGVNMEFSDEILVQLAQQGVESAFRQLVERYHERIINVCFRIVGNDQDAEEAAMDTFMACYRSIGTFEGRSRFSTWLYRIARRCAYKKKGRVPPENLPIDELHPPEDDLTIQPDGSLQEQEIREKVEEAIEALPDHLKEVVVLCFLEGLPYHEISEILDCPIGTVSSRINTARQLLQRRLKPFVEE